MSTADSVSDSASSTSASRFSLVVGGPFNNLLRHLRLTETDLLPTWRAAVLFKGLA